MSATVRTEVWRGPAVMIYPDGRRIATERKAIIVTDIRQTSIGPINFGYTRLMPELTSTSLSS